MATLPVAETSQDGNLTLNFTCTPVLGNMSSATWYVYDRQSNFSSGLMLPKKKSTLRYHTHLQKQKKKICHRTKADYVAMASLDHFRSRALW
jgi:hypothetical protein